MPQDPPNIFPALRYDDAPAAIEWLGRAFGFETHFEVPGPDGSIAHAELRLGAGMIMLGSAKHDHLGMRTPRELGAGRERPARRSSWSSTTPTTGHRSTSPGIPRGTCGASARTTR